jgi:uncharacterized membrane protein YfcA
MLSGWGWLVWPAAFAVQCWVMYRHRQHWNVTISKLCQLGTFCLVGAILCFEVTWFVDRSMNATWTMASLGAVLCLIIVATLWAVRRVPKPFAEFETEFLSVGIGVLSICLALWTAAACFYDGDPAPLGYIPVLNPLDIVQLLAIAVI